MREILKGISTLAGKKKAYIVGGWLRDALMKRTNSDLDVAVGGDPYPLARRAARLFRGSLVKLDEENRIYRVALKGDPRLQYIDFSRLKGRDILADLPRRDFTVNALALEITPRGTVDLSGIIDPLGGDRDIRKRLVRMTSRSVFKDDPVRLLRAFRIAAGLGFTVEPGTRKQIAASAALIRRPAAERLRDEFVRILAADCASVWIRELERTGILAKMIPETARMKTSARRFYYHPQGLWQHAMETLISLERILARLDRFFPKHAGKIRAHLDETLSHGVRRKSLLKLVALLHDAAKPTCARRVGKRMRFLGHETKGAAMAEEILRRLRMSRREIGIARRLVEHHMRPISLGQAATITLRASYRLFRDLDGDLLDLLLLSLADCYSYQRLRSKITVDLARQRCAVDILVDRYFEKEEAPPPRLLNGHRLMEAFGLPSGPIIGRILKMVDEAQATGKITTPREALELVRRRLTPLKKRYKIE